MKNIHFRYEDKVRILSVLVRAFLACFISNNHLAANCRLTMSFNFNAWINETILVKLIITQKIENNIATIAVTGTVMSLISCTCPEIKEQGKNSA